MLEIKEIEVYYGKINAVKRVTLHVGKGEVVTLLGSNGAGKTTILNTISGILRTARGSIYFNGINITHAPAEKIVALGISHVPEGRLVFKPMSVEDNLLLGAYCRFSRKHRKEIEGDLERIFSIFPVLKERRKQAAGTLSGGEQQMLVIGRALMASPKLLLLDEPSMGLAPFIIKQIYSYIVELRKEYGLTVLLVEQNARNALKIADRGYVLETGKIVLEGTSAELLTNKNVQRAYLGQDI